MRGDVIDMSLGIWLRFRHMRPYIGHTRDFLSFLSIAFLFFGIILHIIWGLYTRPCPLMTRVGSRRRTDGGGLASTYTMIPRKRDAWDAGQLCILWKQSVSLHRRSGLHYFGARKRRQTGIDESKSLSRRRTRGGRRPWLNCIMKWL